MEKRKRDFISLSVLGGIGGFFMGAGLGRGPWDGVITAAVAVAALWLVYWLYNWIRSKRE